MLRFRVSLCVVCCLLIVDVVFRLLFCFVRCCRLLCVVVGSALLCVCRCVLFAVCCLWIDVASL